MRCKQAMTDLHSSICNLAEVNGVIPFFSRVRTRPDESAVHQTADSLERSEDVSHDPVPATEHSPVPMIQHRGDILHPSTESTFWHVPHHSHRLTMMQFAIGAWRKFWSKQLMQQSSGTLLKFSVTKRNLLRGCNKAWWLPDSKFQKHRCWWWSRWWWCFVSHILDSKSLLKALQLDIKTQYLWLGTISFHLQFILFNTAWWFFLTNAEALI